MRILVVGDTHGNIPWLTGFIYPAAVMLNADAIVQVGDFGYWEHTFDGVRFLNLLNEAASASGIPLYWLHGNHDKHSLALKRYNKARDAGGFIVVRSHVKYIPQGHVWEWQGRRFRVFGGAYSVDKRWRIEREQRKYQQLMVKEQARQREGKPPKRVPSQVGTLWFPEEEMSDVTMDKLLAADSGNVHYVFSHDKPRSSAPGWNRKDFPECLPNQDRLQRALLVHEPLYWFHGHLHHFYTDTVRTQHGGTVVVGLDCDDQAAEHRWRAEQAYATIDLREDGTDRVLLGPDSELALDRVKLAEIRQELIRHS